MPPAVRFSVGGGEYGFVFARSAGTMDEPVTSKLIESDRKALSNLATFGDEGATYTEWLNAGDIRGRPSLGVSPVS